MYNQLAISAGKIAPANGWNKPAELRNATRHLVPLSESQTLQKLRIADRESRYEKRERMLKFETIRLLFAQRSSQRIAACVKGCATYSSREVFFSQMHSLKCADRNFQPVFLPENYTLCQFQLSRRFFSSNFSMSYSCFLYARTIS